MNKNFINFRTGLVKLPVIIAGVFFLSHPTVTHASENTSATEENTNVAHEENHATSESNNIDNTEDSTNESNGEVTNTSADNKETDKDTNSANNESTAPSDNSSTANNADENDSEDTNKPTADTSTDTETKESSTAGSESPANTTNEDDSDDSAYSDPEAKYDTSKDPNYDEEGILKDTRKKLANMDVENRTVYVYVENDNYTGEIENLKHGIGTGSVIGNKYILTAAHVIYNNNYPRGYMTGGYVVPGKHDGREPFGRYKIKNLYVHDKYKETPYSRYDIGIIEIEPHEDAVESIIELTPYNIKPFNMNMIGKKVKMQGYPIDKIKESVDQWGVDGTIIRKLERGTIEYSMFDHPGLSGSPVFLEDNADDIVAVHTFGTQGNEYGTLGTPITKEIYNWIQSIINKDAKVDEPSKPAEQPKADEPSTPAEQPKADEPSTPAEQPKADEPSTPAEQPKVDEPTTPAEQPKVDEPSTPAEQPKVDEPTTPAEQPKADEPTTPAEQPKVDEPSTPAEQPKVDDTTKPAEQPKADDTKQAVKATQINNTDKTVTATQVSTSQAQNKAQSNAKHDEKQLPKTGENEAITTTLFGTLFAMLGSLLFFRKRKADK
ncbi:trypsin-like serine protease [Mammaliicoccus sciuri]|uniref:trypsin-like serine protease n=1 Tax=Mammaliicoccus sciuri TaxID=1296 RepID=UPI002DBAF57C|nr:trypsin-like serine protease [Mammaliicoccus sciuri]MEB6226919.1 trypsin-like serine protease [Mammaliicoccus sciuri]